MGGGGGEDGDDGENGGSFIYDGDGVIIGMSAPASSGALQARRGGGSMPFNNIPYS